MRVLFIGTLETCYILHHFFCTFFIRQSLILISTCPFPKRTNLASECPLQTCSYQRKLTSIRCQVLGRMLINFFNIKKTYSSAFTLYLQNLQTVTSTHLTLHDSKLQHCVQASCTCTSGPIQKHMNFTFFQQFFFNFVFSFLLQPSSQVFSSSIPHF